MLFSICCNILQLYKISRLKKYLFAHTANNLKDWNYHTITNLRASEDLIINSRNAQTSASMRSGL